ncbi:MAG TPA: hypothetical protein VN025_08810 [Candidatus Dormibacteraeota bacterium]|jgi:hypothetical protein|nr:hypothetical protein [Candidatus Dormibacteraeota bacterium]
MSRFRHVLVLVCSFSLISVSSPAQQSSPPAISALALLQQSLAAQVGNTQISDVTLTGTARRIAGSDDESGTVTLKVLSSGATRLDFNFPSGPRSEFKSFVSNAPTGGWSGPYGVIHSIADHNLVNDWGWFPVFTIAASTNVQSSILTLIGSETRNNESVIHIAASQQFPALSSDVAALTQHLSQIDIFLDATTLFPASIAYNIHPDNNALLDIPVELRFSDYRAVNGAQIPFHIQKFINSTLALDLQFQNAALNTGITAAQVGAQ